MKAPTTKIEQYGKIAEIIAYICALIAGGGATIGFHDMTQSWLIAALAGAGITTILGLGNHIILGMARRNRTRHGIAAVVGAAMLLAMVAIATSSWALTTAIAGPAAQRIHLLDTTQTYDDAVNVARARIDAQSGITEAVSIAAARYRAAAQDEELGRRGLPGCGPNCRAYAVTAANYEALSASFVDLIKEHDQALLNARKKLDELRRNAVSADTLTFGENTTAISAAISAVRMLDLHPKVSNIGVVSHQATDLHRFDSDLRRETKQISGESPEVIVPVYRPISNAEAVYQYRDRVAGAWAAALGIDLTPLILTLLLLLAAREPLISVKEPPPLTPAERDAAIIEQAKRLSQDHSNENEPKVEPERKAEPEPKTGPGSHSA